MATEDEETARRIEAVGEIVEALGAVAATRAGLRTGEPTAQPRAPTLPRWYESAAIDLPGTGAAFRIVSIPPTPADVARWDLGELRDVSLVESGANELGLTVPVYGSVGTDDLRRALLALRPDLAATYIRSPSENTDFRGFTINLDPELSAFVARFATDPIVAVEESPLHGTSIINLLRTTGATATLAVSAVTHEPYLLLAVPIGIVLIGGARGVAAGLEEGLYRRIVKALTGTDPGKGTEDRPEGRQADAE
jgi:hypothetical protein